MEVKIDKPETKKPELVSPKDMCSDKLYEYLGTYQDIPYGAICSVSPIHGESTRFVLIVFNSIGIKNGIFLFSDDDKNPLFHTPAFQLVNKDVKVTIEPQ